MATNTAGQGSKTLAKDNTSDQNLKPNPSQANKNIVGKAAAVRYARIANLQKNTRQSPFPSSKPQYLEQVQPK